MIIYGVKLDTTEMSEERRDELDEYNENDVTFMTGYSVGCYEPEMAVFGITLDSTSVLFNPVVLRDIIKASEKLTGEMVDELKSALTKVDLTDHTPEIYIFDESDD